MKTPSLPDNRYIQVYISSVPQETRTPWVILGNYDPFPQYPYQSVLDRDSTRDLPLVFNGPVVTHPVRVPSSVFPSYKVHLPSPVRAVESRKPDSIIRLMKRFRRRIPVQTFRSTIFHQIPCRRVGKIQYHEYLLLG